jgi:osmoprotectant transport system permease protein
MSLLGDAFSWLGDKANYRGDQGVLQLAVSHLEVTGIAIGIAVAIALPIGIALGHFHRGGPAVTLLANVTRAVPTLGLLYLLAAMPSFGVSQKTAIISLAAFAIPPILTNAWAAVSAADEEAVSAARGLGMKQGQILRRVELPLAVPLIFAGLRSSTLQTFATATIASYVGSNTLGNLIQLGQAAGPPGQREVLGAALIIAFMAVLIDVVLALIQRRLTPAPLRPQLARITRRRANLPDISPGVG